MEFVNIIPKTRAVWGRTRVAFWSPPLKRVKDVLYVSGSDPAWGIYDQDGWPILEAGEYHGPKRRLIHPTGLEKPLDLAKRQWSVESGSFYYCGLTLPHYGHTLLTTLSRYWIFAKARKAKDRILYHGVHPFSLPYLAFWLSHLGLKEADFVTLNAPTKLQDLKLVAASFEELYCAYTAFSALCRSIAQSAGAFASVDRTLPPIYLSKSKVSRGVSKFLNEDELEFELQALGVRIVFPEQLPFAEQIRLFNQSPLILGTAGSAMHTSLFSEQRNRLAIITYEDVIHGNNILIDRISNNKSVYLSPPIDPVDAVPGFELGFKFRDVKLTARGLLEWGRQL